MADAAAVRTALTHLAGEGSVRYDAEALAPYRCDTWSLARLWRLRDQLGPPPLCVVAPPDTEAVRRILAFANRERIGVVPFGAGSGVCGGVLPAGDSIVLDMGRMNRLLEVNETALVARAQAGMMGNAFEAALEEKGFSSRHFPQSIDISTVGGWVATRSAGQFSTRYGSIEDALVGCEVVLADGRVVRTAVTPRASTGPDLRQIFLGSEGTLGVITEATLRIHPLPASQELLSYRFADMRTGLEVIRETVRDGWRPPVVRLYDGVETERNFSSVASGSECLLLLVSEGAEALTAAEAKACRAYAEAAGGTDCGPEPVRHWLAHRNEVPTFESFLERGFVLDTIEVAATWDRIGAVYDGVVTALRAIPGMVAASGHSSHSYLTGTNIYFTFAARPSDPRDAEALYRLCWDTTMAVTLARGGSIAHHHGIGRVRREWMAREHGEGIAILRALKAALDPNGILNPGVLLPL